MLVLTDLEGEPKYRLHYKTVHLSPGRYVLMKDVNRIQGYTNVLELLIEGYVHYTSFDTSKESISLNLGIKQVISLQTPCRIDWVHKYYDHNHDWWQPIIVEDSRL